MIYLTDKKCVACEGGMPPLTKAQIDELKPQTPEWFVSDDLRFINREFTFKDFKQTLAFVNKVGELAESEGHHPDLFIHDYKKLAITLTTYAVKGLSENDFILAAKIDLLAHTDET
ncbi:MAG: 4a-hydroxytetrahydrobiopterin dehydratase [Patescibacteria group bacterium]